MGTSGPGNITHIDNLYVKTFDVQDNVNIVIGDFVVIEATGARPLLATDTTGGAIGDFIEVTTKNIVQAGEDANNLTTTDPLLRKDQIECITKGSDWVVKMGAGVLPDNPVSIFLVTVAPVVTEVRLNADRLEVIGVYKHKEFSTVATPSLLDDNGIISTGRLI